MEEAGYLLLLAAAHQTGLIQAREAALPENLPADNGRRHHGDPDCRRSLLLTLLFLPAVGLKRTHDLRGYTVDALGLLTGRRYAYSYRHIERFLSVVARAGGAETLTDALARWTAKLWRPELQLGDGAPPACYVDGHRKAVHTNKLLPRGLVSRYGKVLGCRTLMLLHDEHGRPLLALTRRGDTHLTVGLPQLLERHEVASGQRFVRRVIVDRAGMAAEFLGRLAKSGCDVVTVLRSNQYKGLGSFTEVGEIVPLSHDKHGNLTREVASARYSLSLLDRSHARLDLRVALLRNLRRMALRSEPRDGPRSLHEDYSNSPSGIDGDWVATPSPSVSTEPALVPIVTTAREFDPVELARTYIHRWPVQENMIRDWLFPLGLDTNHGYAKMPTANSEAEKKRTTLERRLANARRWGEQARLASLRAQKTSDRQWKKAKEHSRKLNREMFELDAQSVGARVSSPEAGAGGRGGGRDGWQLGGLLPGVRFVKSRVRQVRALLPRSARDHAST